MPNCKKNWFAFKTVRAIQLFPKDRRLLAQMVMINRASTNNINLTLTHKFIGISNGFKYRWHKVNKSAGKPVKFNIFEIGSV